MFRYAVRENTDFLLLNDMFPDNSQLENLTDFVSQHMKCTVHNVNQLIDLANPMLNLNINQAEILAVGGGGELVSKKLLKGTYCQKIEVRRKWQCDTYQIYIGETPTLTGSKVHVLDDVLASGETLFRVREILDPLHEKIFSSTVLVTSGNVSSKYRNGGGVIGYRKLSSVLLVESDSNADSYWYPAIYSMRHLLFNQDCDPRYLERISKKYFDGKLEAFRTIIEQIKSEHFVLNKSSS